MKNIFAQTPDKEAENILFATGKLLQLLNIKVTGSTLRKKLLSHPHYLSLLSITETLQQWNIETSALKIEAKDLIEVPCPFIAYLSSGRKFITITDVSTENVYYYNEKNKKLHYPHREFREIWGGVILLAEPTEESGEVEYKEKIYKEWIHNLKIPLLLLFLLCAFIVKSYVISRTEEYNSSYFISILACKFLGVIVTSLLLLYEYDSQNSFINQICSVGKKANCAAVLSSSVSKIAGTISWSEAGFGYFLGGFLYPIIAGTEALPFLYLLNLIALPFIIFSLSYQAFKIRQWCVLCLGVIFLLLSEFFCALLTKYSMPALVINANSALLIFLSFLLPLFSWFFIKPYIYQAKSKIALEFQLARFKGNADVFQAMLSKQPFINGDTKDLGITIGNPDAENTLIKVCNPYCGPCAKAHPKIDNLIKNNPNWKVQIIFSEPVNKGDIKFITVSHLMAVAEKCENENNEWLKQKALDDWYASSKKSANMYQSFAAKYPVNGTLLNQENKVDAMYKWCEKNAVKFTPTFFVNGYQLPEQYEIADLQYL